MIANTVFVGSILVGLLGAYYHFIRAILPNAPPGLRISVNLLIWAPPVVGPLVFSLVGLLGISAVWKEEPGRLRSAADLGRTGTFSCPTAKPAPTTSLISLGTLATLALQRPRSRPDRLRKPVAVGPGDHRPAGGACPRLARLSGGTAAGRYPDPRDRHGPADSPPVLIGSWLHIQNNLTADLQFVPERFIRGAPVWRRCCTPTWECWAC